MSAPPVIESGAPAVAPTVVESTVAPTAAATPAIGTLPTGPLPKGSSAARDARSGGDEAAPEDVTGSEASAATARHAIEPSSDPSAAPTAPGATSAPQDARDPGAPRTPHGTGTRLATLTPIESGFPWERSPLAGIPSTKILAELQRRRERSATLLAERDRIVELMQAIEAELQVIGHDIAAGDAHRAIGNMPAGRKTRPDKPGRGPAVHATGAPRRGRPSSGTTSRTGLGRKSGTSGKSGNSGTSSASGKVNAKRAADGRRSESHAGTGHAASRIDGTSGAPRAVRGARGGAGKHRRPRGTVLPGSPPRAAGDARTISLRDAIALAVEPRALVSPAEAAELVRRNGYATTAKNFGMLVANTLAKDERFRRVGRGSYERIG